MKRRLLKIEAFLLALLLLLSGVSPSGFAEDPAEQEAEVTVAESDPDCPELLSDSDDSEELFQEIEDCPEAGPEELPESVDIETEDKSEEGETAFDPEAGEEEEKEDETSRNPVSDAPTCVPDGWEREYPMEIPDDFIAPESVYAGVQPQGMLPERYDARDSGTVTCVKDQGEYELCWAFSALAVGESSLLQSGRADAAIDLSEMHLGAAFSGDAYDPMGNTAGDGSYLAESYLISGNNNKFTTFALANWIGAADEAAYPYVPMEELAGAARTEDIAHMTDARWINAQNRDAVKAAILSNGSVGISVYYRADDLNTQTSAYYNPSYTATNHAVTVIGWDDAFPAEAFNTLPPEDGAWLIKNSAGEAYGEDGCFWLSYADAAITNTGATAFLFAFDTARNYDSNYHYDGAFGTRADSVENGGEVANVFVAAGNPQGGDELLEAVGIALASADVSYSLQIYTDIRDPMDPTSGTPAYLQPQTGSTSYSGYYSIPLEEPVRLAEGERFAVVFRLENAFGHVNYFVDQSYINSAWIRFVSHTEAGQSFLRQPGGDWADLHNSGETARVKAYTVNADARKLRSLHFAQQEAILEPGGMFLQIPEPWPLNPEPYTLEWTSSDEDVATVANDGLVTAVRQGDCVITATALNGSVLASYRLEVRTKLNAVIFRSRKETMQPGERFTPAVALLPDEAAGMYDIRLSSSDETTAVIDGGTVAALHRGRTVIRASAGSKFAEYTLTVIQPLDGAELEITDTAYRGRTVTPTVTVRVDGETLEPGTDYTLSFKNNKKPGTGSVTVTGIDLWTGTLEEAFSITVEKPILTEAKNTDAGIALQWETVEGISGFRVYRSCNGGKWSLLKTIKDPGTLNFTDAGAVKGGAVYRYHVSAFISAGKNRYESAGSEEAALPRVLPTALIRFSRSEEGIQVGWKANRTADAYLIFRQTGESEPELLYRTESADERSYLDAVIPEPGVVYRYSVAAVKLWGETEFSGTASNRKSVCIPAAPEQPALSNAISGITVVWQSPAGAETVEIWRSVNGGDWKRVCVQKSGSGTWTDWTAEKSGATYAYRLLAVSSQPQMKCRSGFSAETEIMRLSRPIIGSLKAEESGVVLRWRRTDPADGYIILRSAEGKAEETVAEVTDALSWLDESAQAGTTYRYRIRAYAETVVGRTFSADSATRILRIKPAKTVQ